MWLPDARAFSHPENNVGDVLRIASMVFGTLVIAQLLGRARSLYKRFEDSHYRSSVTCLFISLAAFTSSAILTDIERLGMVVTWRLPVNITGLVFAMIALTKMGQAERDIGTGQKFGEFSKRHHHE